MHHPEHERIGRLAEVEWALSTGARSWSNAGGRLSQQVGHSPSSWG